MTDSDDEAMLVETEIKQLTESEFDMVEAYRVSVHHFGKQNVFLLESLGGPAQDARQSILGMHCLASIDITAECITVNAASALSSYIARAIDDTLGEPRMVEGCARFNSSNEIWQVLRCLNGLFKPTRHFSGFHFGYLACFSYDLARVIEILPQFLDEEDFPFISLALFQSYFIADETGAHLVVNHGSFFPPPPTTVYQAIVEAVACSCPIPLDDAIAAATVMPSMDKSRFIKHADTAMRHIRMGDIYQVQIGHEIRVQTVMDPFHFYQRLRRFNPSPYMFLCHLAGHDLIGSSPENYILLEQGGVSMRPIAGTIAKSAAETCQKAADELATSRKENAEHIMLVDLCRNDIARVCETGTLEVPSLMAVEEFPEMFHLVSTVTARVASDRDVFDVIRATFPAGTMTGAPKIRAMEIIEKLEVSRRGVYSGAIGLVGPNDYANLALCIRMASHKEHVYRLRACAGIVADSDPEKEWQETLIKMNAVFKALTGRKLEL